MNYFWKHVMPWIAAATIILVLAFTAKSDVPKLSDEELEKLSADAIRRTKEHAAELVKDIAPHATAAEAKIAQLEGSIKILAVNNVDLETTLKTVQTTATALEKHDAEQTKRADDEKLRADAAQKLASHRGVLLSWLGAAVGFFLGMQVLRLFPTIPYAFLIPPALAIAGWFAALML